VLVASTSHVLGGPTGISDDGRRTWAAAVVDDVLLVSVHLDPEWPQRQLHGATQARDLVAWCDAREATTVVVLGDINAAWVSPTGDVLRRAGFEAPSPGATAATNGRTRQLDVVAARGCAAVAVAPSGLPAAGSPMWLPDALVASDHAPLLASIG
jgi:endonuclease/exonuclease/phosphatase family metal-dependent hydrolase